jgi:hypothetical protein
MFLPENLVDRVVQVVAEVDYASDVEEHWLHKWALFEFSRVREALPGLVKGLLLRVAVGKSVLQL